MYLDKTIEVYNMILEEYSRLGDEGILVIDYTGYARDYSLYHLLAWYVSYENSQSKYNFDNRYFNYHTLMELLINSNIDYIDEHISTENINENFKKMTSTDNSSFKRNFETISKIYVGDRVKEKIKTRKLKNQ